MDSIRTELKIVIVFTLALCLNVTLSLGDEPGRDFRPSLGRDQGPPDLILLAQTNIAPAAVPTVSNEPKRDTAYLQAPAKPIGRTSFPSRIWTI